MATSNSASQASTSGTNKRPRSRSASESGEDRPAPAFRAANNPTTGSEMVVGGAPQSPEHDDDDQHEEVGAVAQVQVDHKLPERRLSFDPDGDLRLAVGEECPGATPATYKVDSRALSRASAVFRQMLHIGVAESHRPEGATGSFACPRTRPLQFLSYPSYIQLIYDLVVVTEKHALTHCLRPWARSWTGKWLREKAESDTGKKPGRSNDAAYVPLQKSLYIMWELGHRPEFESIIVELAWCSRLDDDGNLWSRVTAHRRKAELFDDIASEPEGAYETIAATRQKAVSRLLTPLLSLVPEMIADVPSDVPYHDYIIDDINCMLGATLRSIKKYRLWPLPRCDTYADPVYQLTTSLKGVIRVLRRDHSQNSVLLGRINDLQKNVDGILRDKLANKLRPVLSASQVRRLEARGKETGLYRRPATQ
ncbi:hypothetical protein PG995_015829 [Apiospora arundinis]